MAKKTVRGTKAENLLLQLFKKKPDIHQSGRLLAHLENELNGQVSQNDILLALERMERRRKSVKLERSGKVLNRVTYIQGLNPYPAGDQTEEAKRQRRFAKGVPATLTNEQCSPVVVRHFADPVRNEPTPVVQLDDLSDETVEVNAKVASLANGAPTPETLTLALMALIHRADSRGVVDGNSATAIILNDLKCTLDQAKHLNHLLGSMGVRASKRVGRGMYQHTVDTSITAITDEMMAQRKSRPRQGNGAKVLRRQSVPVPVSGDIAASLSAPIPRQSRPEPAQPVQEGVVEPSIVERLLRVIEMLEAEKAGLVTENTDLKNKCNALAEQVEQYEVMVQQIRRQAERHTEDVDTVLRRYSV